MKKPKTHEDLHTLVAQEVKGVLRHEAEFRRLMVLYDESTETWERAAVNRALSRCGVAARNAKTPRI